MRQELLREQPLPAQEPPRHLIVVGPGRQPMMEHSVPFGKEAGLQKRGKMPVFPKERNEN